VQRKTIQQKKKPSTKSQRQRDEAQYLCTWHKLFFGLKIFQKKRDSKRASRSSKKQFNLLSRISVD
jgi:hypothetical protein